MFQWRKQLLFEYDGARQLGESMREKRISLFRQQAAYVCKMLNATRDIMWKLKMDDGGNV